MRELVDHTIKARAFSDHLWHAKGLENILVCMLLLLWAGVDFKIPQICYPITGKALSIRSSVQTPSASANDVSTLGSPKSSTQGNAARNLADLLPELIDMILNIYGRAANFAGEAMPQLAMAEYTIRSAKSLAALHLAHGVLSAAALDHLVRSVPFELASDLFVPKPTIRPTKHDISSILFDALPYSSEASRLTAIDRLAILGGIASVFSSLGFKRQKALIVKEFIGVLIPALVQARKVGAAEMGVHPTAGLAEINMASELLGGAKPLNSGQTGSENNIERVLEVVCRTYGIPELDLSTKVDSSDRQVQHSTEPVESDLPSAASLQRLSDLAASRSFGSLNLKLDILRTCIDLSEALPTFEGVLHFTAALLRAAGPARAPSFNAMGVLVVLAKEEQVRLATNISRTINAAKTIGLKHLETDYWDDFLVRGVTLMEPPPPKLLLRHRKTELEGTRQQSKANGPFIHNPFMKKPETLDAELVLAAGEQYEFIVTLQNLYEFDLEIESLKLACYGVELESLHRDLWLGPWRAQKFAITAVARSTGTARVTGCIVKIRGCREREFPIFREPWRAAGETKIKGIGLRAVEAPSSLPSSGAPASSDIKHATASPITSSLVLTVLPQQPIARLSHISIPQSAVMVLEGERKIFSMTVENLTDTTVDFIHVSLQDSTMAPLQAMLSNKTVPPAEFYEYERQLLDPCVRLLHSSERQPTQINPKGQTTFQIEILGRYGLTECVAQFDYAHLGVPSDQISDKFYTRQLSVPIAITVNAAVQLHRIDIVPFLGDFAWSNQHRQRAFSRTSSDKSTSRRSLAKPADEGGNPFKSLLGRVGRRSNDADHCLVLLDLRNGWPNPLSISIQVREKSSGDDTPDEEWRRAYTVHSLIQPGHVERLLMLLPKTYLKNPHLPIPSLNPVNQRQYVVSASNISPEVERANRELFWCREFLLSNIRGSWEDNSSGRKGDIDLQGIRLSSKMTEAMRLDDIAVEMSITSGMNGTANSVRQFGRSRFDINIDEQLVLTTKLYNRSASPILPLLRLQPRLANQPHGVALDLDKRFTCDGLLQRPFPLLHPGQTAEAVLGICASCAGHFEIGATVEEIQPWHEERGCGDQNRTRADTGRLHDNLIGGIGKRTWHASEVCSIVAKQPEVGWIEGVLTDMTESERRDRHE
ncbi:hypothetical protein H2201_003739 [Coniosporium apollinis]|uniref:Hypercellular protein HypA n=1 Tax=Coniosporium apollinis TaxID=61459 RepID=A0ABQ9NUJ2_9PEZI|nr:hypothetical protein H2201_003739 [Coniosporium apollinis]